MTRLKGIKNIKRDKTGHCLQDEPWARVIHSPEQKCLRRNVIRRNYKTKIKFLHSPEQVFSFDMFFLLNFICLRSSSRTICCSL